MDQHTRYERKKRRLFMRIIILSILMMTIAYLFYNNLIREDVAYVTEGDQAPNFALTNMHGERVALEDYQGQGVFLNFWGTYCPPCEEEMPYMEAEHQKYMDKDVEILAVNVGESELIINRFAERLQLTFPILQDQNSNVMDRYGVRQLPATYLIDESGEVIHIRVGGMSEQNVRDFMEMIDPEV
ncbi:thiol-disulfide oxidoreductase ResA [Geomicrobium sediminis]|uniref:Peroxiredoxin n=1 Tax=Geomicrobium sediminis TaxID=1347788 RepID=A0ABS2PGV1_9BACL|nr:thiol-disulfide oxidoreductase ResA [Geomicrobium sediminis]MBM7634176.1 peroxiredoxin [Geomicrobium sediminis]